MKEGWGKIFNRMKIGEKEKRLKQNINGKGTRK